MVKNHTLVVSEKRIAYGDSTHFSLIPDTVSVRSGLGLLRYIQSLHQYQRNEEQKQKLNGTMFIPEGDRFLNCIGDEIPKKYNENFIKQQQTLVSQQHIQSQPQLLPK